MTRRLISKQEAAEIALRTRDAYGFIYYSEASWTLCAEKLAQQGYDRYHIEAILRSKWMRYAAEAAGKSKWATSTDLLWWMNSTHRGLKEVRELASTVFPAREWSGMDLASRPGAVERLDIAEFIELARDIVKLKDISEIADLQARATKLMDRIEGRASL